MGVNYLYVSAATTVASLVGLHWWVASLVDGIKSDGLIEGGEIHSGNLGRALELVLGSRATLALLANFAVNVFVLVVLCLKTLFFVELHPSETRKLLERLVNYVIYKGTFLPLVVPPDVYRTVMWSAWLLVLSFLKMFQSLARDRLERFNASPSATPSKYFRVFSALLFVLAADLLWLRLCMIIYKSFSSNLYLLLFFEPLSIAFETLQAVMVHGFQLLDIWQRHSIDTGVDCFSTQTSYKSASGSLSEWKGNIIRNGGFLLDIMALLMALGHYLIIWWLHGMAVHLVDAILFLNLRAHVSLFVKRIKVHVKLTKALSSLDGALPDATYEDLCSYNDECAICRVKISPSFFYRLSSLSICMNMIVFQSQGPMARAKKLSCNHLFHLPCLRSWLDQGLTEVYSCPTCRRPLFPSGLQEPTSSLAGGALIGRQITERINLGMDQQRISGHLAAIPNQEQNPSDTVWGGIGYDSSWVPHWPNPGINDGASTSSSIRSVGLSGVQMMMRQLTSVGDNYARSPLEDPPWNLWPSNHTSGSSVTPPPSLRYNRNAGGLRFRNTSPSVNGNMSEVLTMVDRVREVLPHIPDELIIQDLLRTNNINITVNNLLQLQ